MKVEERRTHSGCIRVLSALCHVVVAAADFVSAKLTQFSGLADDSTRTFTTSMASPRLSTRHFGIRKPAQVWTDAASRPSPPFGPGA
jgi:hypothetical protein